MLCDSLDLSHRTAPEGRNSVHCKRTAQADTHTLLNMQTATMTATRTGQQKEKQPLFQLLKLYLILVMYKSVLGEEE